MSMMHVHGWMMALGAVLASGAAASAAAQAPFVQTIEAVGTATVDAAPDYVEFVFERILSAPSLAKACEAAAGFEPRFRDLLKEHELAPSEVEITAPLFAKRTATSVSTPPHSTVQLEMRVQARVRFAVADFGTDAQALDSFARIYDKLKAVAAAVPCSPPLPRFGVFDPMPIEQAAIGKAVEAAYPHGEAAAQIMRARIVAVQHVSVEEVVWSSQNAEAQMGFGLKGLGCRAQVRVTYVFNIAP